MQTALAIAGAYLLGSISFAVLVSKVMGLPDPHTYGSKNPGATNVLRTGSKAAALLTLIGDSCKGAVAVLLAAFFVTTVPLELALVKVTRPASTSAMSNCSSPAIGAGGSSPRWMARR